MTFEEAIQKAHIAKIRKGDIYFIIRYEDKFKLIRNSGYNGPYNINGDGKSRFDDQYDIVALYTIIGNDVCCIDDLFSTDKELIWKEDRPVLEVNMQEIANKFGVPVEYIRIKE